MENKIGICIALVLIGISISLAVIYNHSQTICGKIVNKYVNEFVTTTDETTSISTDSDGNIDITTDGDDTTSVHRRYIIVMETGTEILVDELVATVPNHQADAVSQCISKLPDEPNSYTYLRLNSCYVLKIHGFSGGEQLDDATPIESVRVEK